MVVKCQPGRIPELLETAAGITPPDSHFNAKYWIGMDLQSVEESLLKELVENSFGIVRGKYGKKQK